MPRKESKIKHGTNAGYAAELRRGLPTCARCRKAHRVMRQAHRTRAKEQYA